MQIVEFSDWRLMLVSDDSALIGNGDGDIGVFIQNNALTGEATFQARIEGAINKILFFVGYFLQKILSFFDINVTSGAGANAAAIVVQVHIVFLGDLQNGHIGIFAHNGLGRYAFVLK